MQMINLPIVFRKISIRSGILSPSKFQLFCRKCSGGKSNGHNEKSNPAGEGYTTVYKFPWIRHMSVFSRLKIYHAAGVIISVPVSFVLASQGIVDAALPLATTYIGLGTGAFLGSLSVVTNRYIGFIYFNGTKETVKVAYVDFWGKRREQEIPLRDIMPFSEASVNYIGQYFYKPLQRYSGGKTLKVNLNYGTVIDQEKFQKIFPI
ncbi:transmembrane protein 186 [Coccinella septempunctata]|uniref:transmembrane protein 186 n=1 Tax=Coccinella septempunctata TaxID=41139 RepID=UPI001D0940E8|nr:transmembrane protein 186 [Coccinella septempunctata]